MKVLDLQCGSGHTFEGWFGSEGDFTAQQSQSLVQCPWCGDANVLKKPSAPRLNLLSGKAPKASGTAAAPTPPTDASPTHRAADAGAALADHPALAAAWMQMARAIVARTEDVGTGFAEVARQMHYGETEERAIRGKTTPNEARALLEEGIEILPFVLPEALKNPLQ